MTAKPNLYRHPPAIRQINRKVCFCHHEDEMFILTMYDIHIRQNSEVGDLVGNRLQGFGMDEIILARL